MFKLGSGGGGWMTGAPSTRKERGFHRLAELHTRKKILIAATKSLFGESPQ